MDMDNRSESSSSSGSTPPASPTMWRRKRKLAGLIQASDLNSATQDSEKPDVTVVASSRGTTTIKQRVVQWLLWIIGGVLVSCAVTAFSLYLPFFLAPDAAHKTYLPAFYRYDVQVSFFDNTAWTYGTDYALALAMAPLGLSIWFSHRTVAARLHAGHSTVAVAHATTGTAVAPTTASLVTLRWVSACLLWSYAVSVTAGGIAHQFYFTADDRNTWSFRTLWFLCVGSVTAASGWMGCIAAQLLRRLKDTVASTCASLHIPPDTSTTLSQPLFLPRTSGCNFDVPLIPELFWIGYGITSTLFCFWGFMSYQRPACDIFVAGITQFVSSFYMMAVAGWSFRDMSYIRPSYRWVCVASWILNAPLLPLYPLLIQYTDWTLAKVNTFLHCWLLAAWTLQGLTLQHYIAALLKTSARPIKAIPIKIPTATLSSTTTTTTTSMTKSSTKPTLLHHIKCP